MVLRIPDKALIADLANHPGWRELREWAISERDAYFKNLANTLYDNPENVTAQDLQYKRGFFRGIFRLLNEPVIDAKALARELDKKEVTSSE